MKERLRALIESLTENQVIYAFTFLSKMFGKVGEF